MHGVHSPVCLKMFHTRERAVNHIRYDTLQCRALLAEMGPCLTPEAASGLDAAEKYKNKGYMQGLRLDLKPRCLICDCRVRCFLNLEFVTVCITDTFMTETALSKCTYIEPYWSCFIYGRNTRGATLFLCSLFLCGWLVNQVCSVSVRLVVSSFRVC